MGCCASVTAGLGAGTPSHGYNRAVDVTVRSSVGHRGVGGCRLRALLQDRLPVRCAGHPAAGDVLGEVALDDRPRTGEAAVAKVKFFDAYGSWSWYASEYDPEQGLFFGLVCGHEKELGYVSLAELESVRFAGRQRIERDPHWKPRPLAECAGS